MARPGRQSRSFAPPPQQQVIQYFPPGPVGARFLNSDAFVCGIRGPFGSGKSTLCVMKLVRNFQKQTAGPDKVKRRRTAIIRNTYPELKTTTIKTWHQWIPASLGRWVDQGPPTHRVIEVKNGTLVSDWEVIFVALDRPEDVRKLLSMEISDAWINEAREVPKAILDGLTGRVGRYPPVNQGGCTDPQIILDTNPPDTDHWWAKLADFPDADIQIKTEQLEAELQSMGSLRVGQRLYEFYAQPGGRVAPVYGARINPSNGEPEQTQIGGAENLDHLDPGYYLKLSAGKSEDWIKVYVDADYGFVVEGRPVYPEYRDSTHCREFEINPHLPLYIGIDFGLTPAAVFGQRTATGTWRWHSELVSFDMGAKRFGEELAQYIRDRYPNLQIAAITGDPAGDSRAQTDEITPFQILRSVGVEAKPAVTNDFTKRRESVAMYLNRMVDGQPALVIHPACAILRKGMTGGYCYRRIQIAGQEKYRDVPDKNEYSHACDAAQYMMLGAGEAKTVIARDPQLPNNKPRPRFAMME